MILRRLVMDNFRQFRGKQEVVFAVAKKSNGPNITVLFGENGRGKTGIFRALMFCLYGDRVLSQDEETSKAELALVNLHELKSGSGRKGTPVEAFVEVEFTHGEKRYRIKRTVRGILHGNVVQEEVGDVLLTIQDGDGNSVPISDPRIVQSKVAEVLDPRVKEYFLFDGEKIERLTRASSEQRREVAKGIRNLLNIDDLEVAIRVSKRLCRELDSEIQGKSTGEHARIIQQINEAEDRQGSISKTVSKLEDESHRAKVELQKVDKELEQYKEISHLLKDRQDQEKLREELVEQSDATLGQMRSRSGRTAVGMLEPTLRAVLESIEARKRRGELPPEIRSELLQKLLSEGACICGRKIEDGSEAWKHVMQWKERSGDPVVSDSALELWSQLRTVLSRLGDERPVSEAILQRFADIRHKMRAVDARLDEIREQIGGSERKDAAKLEKHRDHIANDLVKFEAEKQNAQAELATVSADLEVFAARRKQLENDLSIRNELVRRSQLATEVHEALSSVFEGFRKDIIERIGKQATELLFLLLDKEGQKNVKAIVVKDDYSLQIVDRWNGQFLANISAGQRQIMSIAFIAALAKAAAGSDNMEIPLFMDTPFGRLSFEHRRNLIMHIPELASQWVLLATDTELTRDEGELLLSGKRLGRFYRLLSDEDGTTSIVEQELDEIQPILSSRRRA